MRDPPTSTGWRATAVALAAAVMATLAGCTAAQQPARRAGGAQLAGPASQDRQEQEICGAAADEAAGFGTRPTLFRPPFGAFDRATLLAAHACHLRAVVEWTATVNDGHLVAVGGRLHPGYIILMHFRPSLPRDLTAALEAIRRAHLSIGRLTGYLKSRT
jgi:hypothetical protein